MCNTTMCMVGPIYGCCCSAHIHTWLAVAGQYQHNPGNLETHDAGGGGTLHLTLGNCCHTTGCTNWYTWHTCHSSSQPTGKYASLLVSATDPENILETWWIFWGKMYLTSRHQIFWNCVRLSNCWFKVLDPENILKHDWNSPRYSLYFGSTCIGLEIENVKNFLLMS